jgi:hypothetical protein
MDNGNTRLLTEDEVSTNKNERPELGFGETIEIVQCNVEGIQQPHSVVILFPHAIYTAPSIFAYSLSTPGSIRHA